MSDHIAANVGDSWFVLFNTKTNNKYVAIAECSDEFAAMEIRNIMNDFYAEDPNDVSYGGSE